MSPQWSRDRTRRFTDRPFYTHKEIEDSVLELLQRSADTASTPPEWPLADAFLERLVESLTKRFDPYADLSHIGVDVDGYTVFARIGKPSVFINSDLDDSRYRARRRMTIGHELGHVALHQILYERDDRQLDLLIPQELTPVYCAKDHIVRSVDWCEWQAGFFGGALLMPTGQLRDHVTAIDGKFLDGVQADSYEAQRVAAAVAEHFEVSRDAARVRLSQVGIIKPAPLRRLDEETA